MISSRRPYLLRALYEWITDNRLTPYIVINAQVPGTKVPQAYVNDKGRIVLDISSEAVYNLHISNTHLQFDASFSSILHHINAPIHAVLAIYAQENGKGMTFDDQPEESMPPPDEGKKTPGTKKSHLKVVK